MESMSIINLRSIPLHGATNLPAQARSSSSVDSFQVEDELNKIEKRLGVKFGSLASDLFGAHRLLSLPTEPIVR